MADSVTVQVALRVRPLVESEVSKGCQLCLDFVQNQPQVLVRGTDKSFTYNYVFLPEDNNEYLYDIAVKNLVNHIFKGYNVTILAYGQTGSGKTYSMGTNYNDENLGVIPRAVNDIFDQMKDMPNKKFIVSVSFMELYQEQLFDLLSPTKNIVDVREDTRGIITPGLTEVVVHNTEETIKCLIRGSAERATGATAMNAQSSRSHAIFTITVKHCNLLDNSDSMTSKFHLVDLAGSERPKKTKAIGERFKEGVNINKGLFALGNVISALGDESQKGYISYRDSRLTRLLQDSLGGNSLTLMIACVSPADYNLEETLSTLRYADRARRIKNKPIVNQDPTAALIAKLKQELQEAHLELMNGNRNQQCPEEHHRLEEEVTNLTNKNRKLTIALNNALSESTNLVERALLAELARDRMKVKLCELQAEYGAAIDNLNQTVDPSTCPAEFWEKLQLLKDVQEKIKDLQAEQKRSAQEILNHELTSGSIKEENYTLEGANDFTAEGLTQVDIDEHHEAHTLQQVELNNELKELNKALALKEELATQIALNSNHILNIKTDYDGVVKDLESQVQNLQKEKDDLLRSLREVQNSTAAAKENEHQNVHSKRLTELEQKITCFKKKIAEQNKMIRMKEAIEKKITVLNSEITSMKQTKVKLIKQMKIESEKFRNWKIQRERELSKLKDQDRKRVNQLVRMERLHTKQQNVLRRKVEEAVAINKRLKDALALQKSAQERRGNMGSIAKVQAWLDQELEVMFSIIDAERTLENLMEDRGLLHEQMTEMKASLASENIPEEQKHELEEDIKQLEENISARNIQIADLQQKICDSDQENKSKTRWDCIQTLPEAKHALKSLFDCAVFLRKEKAVLQSKLEELQMEYQSKVNNCNELANVIIQQEKKMEELTQKQQKDVIRLETKLEENIFDFVNALASGNDTGNIKEIIEDVFKRQERIKELEEMFSNKVEKKKKNKCNPSSQLNNTFGIEYENIDLTDNSMLSTEGNDSDDPDWKKTPVYKRIRTLKQKRSHEDEDSKGVKRSKDGNSKCSCNGSCSTKRCSCMKTENQCSNACKCKVTTCVNRPNGDSSSESIHIKDTTDNVKKPRSLSRIIFFDDSGF